MYAIFKAQGKQFRAEPDARLRIPSLNAQPGDRITFDEVLLAEREGKVRVGSPSLAGAFVEAEVVAHGRGEKIVVFKMKRRKGYRRKQGHRQNFTEIRILDIGIDAAPSPRKAAKQPKKAVPADAAPEPVVKEAAEAPGAESADALDITEAARLLAEEHGLDLSTIQGSGKGGRILKGDVDKLIKKQKES